ncbi:hypothetical protein [Streptomyces sp. NPDC047046]|uniref:hypothetical protein n=1 Tax=Streptomyces sp. NPDC047046 TaxID=3155378 RepID=UPI0033C5AA01
MDAQSYKTALAALRTVRDEIKKTQARLAKLEASRDKQITQLATHQGAKADRIAPAAGLSLAHIVTLAPTLAPATLTATGPAPRTSTASASAENDAPTTPPAQPTAPIPDPAPAAPATDHTPTPPSDDALRRTLPSIPDGDIGDAWFTHTPNLTSTRPNFTQQARFTVFLDTHTGVLVHRQQTHHLDLGAATAADILTAVRQTIPDGVERIYITAGAPWHRDAERYPYLRDAVTAWLNAPTPGWRTDTGRGRDRMAGHFVHARNPVGRYQSDDGKTHVEIRSVGEWFDLDDHDTPATVRDAFVLLWQALRRHWNDAVLMGSPSQTGRDLWSRTIPTRGQYSEGYPVLSEELRGLLHATAGQGRNELLQPPHVPEELPRLVEYDRTFAYAKHTWKSPVGTPRRITAATFAAWSEKEQTRALYKCGHWHLRVTVPHDWNHVGLLPAPAPGDRAWHYPAQPGTTFTTWAGGPEVHTALTNPLQPWKIEILDGILWEDGKPLDDWAKKLKETWANLSAQAHFHGDPGQARAAHLAARAVRSILLYGIGSFAQRPRIVTGTTPRTLERDIPADAEIINFDDHTITWQRPTGFARDPNAHPEWAAAIWSGARAALLAQRHREDGTHAGALHTAPGSVVAFRTDALYLTHQQHWPHHNQPGDYLLKGHLTGPVAAPTTEEELLTLREAGRAALLVRKEA